MVIDSSPLAAILFSESDVYVSAGLNFGDCFAYALAKVKGERLLFKGNDFALTDIGRA